MNTPSLPTLLHLATDAAYLAGRRTLAYFNTGVAVEIKADDTPVTRADRESEELIRARIARYFPTHEIVGEEGGTTRGDPRYRWIIDPIDGTKTFIHGVPFYGVMIGVEIDGAPSVGAVYMPALDEMLCAATGLGCLWNGRKSGVSPIDKLSDAVLLTTNVSTCMARSDTFEKLAAATKFNRTWGDCYGYALVATGRAEIMLDPAMNPWDCAAIFPIIHEAGGNFATWQGEATIYGKDAYACNAALNAQVAEILRAEKRRP